MWVVKEDKDNVLAHHAANRDGNAVLGHVPIFNKLGKRLREPSSVIRITAGIKIYGHVLRFADVLDAPKYGIHIPLPAYNEAGDKVPARC
jgi:hypothetical protein